MKYLNFQFFAVSDSGKTNIWAVENKRNGYHLGWIKWHSQWRQYCFYPEKGTLYSVGCLDDIKNFIDKQNAIHKQAIRVAKPISKGPVKIVEMGLG